MGAACCTAFLEGLFIVGRRNAQMTILVNESRTRPTNPPRSLPFSRGRRSVHHPIKSVIRSEQPFIILSPPPSPHPPSLLLLLVVLSSLPLSSFPHTCSSRALRYAEIIRVPSFSRPRTSAFPRAQRVARPRNTLYIFPRPNLHRRLQVCVINLQGRKI